MLLSLYIFLFLSILNLIFSQHNNIYYNITLLKLKNEICDADSNNYIFEIESNINPCPIYDLDFNLELSSPTGVTAQCKLIDDVLDTIKCHVNRKYLNLEKETFSINENKLIKVNDKINIHIKKLNQKWTTNCLSCFLHINFVLFIILIYFETF